MRRLWTKILFFLLLNKFEELVACKECSQHTVRSTVSNGMERYINEHGYKDRRPSYPIMYQYLICTCNDVLQKKFSLDRMSTEASTAIFNNSTIPVISLGAFSLNKHFRKIYLISSHVKEIESEAFKELTNLTELHLENNELREMKDGMLNTLTSLEILNLSNNKIETLEDKWLLGLSNLQELYLSQNMIKRLSPDAFYGLQGMRVLDLSHNELNEVKNSLLDNILAKYLESHEAKNQSTKLDLSYNHIRSIEFLHFHHLNELNVSNNNLNEVVNLKYVQNLRVLDLGCNNLTSVINLPSTLEYLSVKSNKISNIEILIKSLVNLTSLDLSYVHLKSLNSTLFKNTSALKNLYLQNNELSDIPIGSFQNLNKLAVLNLSSNSLAEFDYGTFAGLENLKVLDVSNNSLNNLLENSLHVLKSLHNLNIASNNLVVLNPRELLSYCKNLQYISLNRNPWICKSLLKTCNSFVSANVTILDGFSVSAKSVRQVHGITCSINEYLASYTTSKPNSENEKTDTREINALKHFLQFEFTNSSFYKYFQNYTNRDGSFKNDSDFFKNFDKKFENSKFYEFFNRTDFLNRFNATVSNFAKTLELSEMRMLNLSLSLHNAQQFYDTTRNSSSNFDENFENSRLFKYFNSDFASSNFFKFFNLTKPNLTTTYLLANSESSKVPPSNETLVGNDKFSFEKFIDNRSETNGNVLQQNTFITFATFIIVLLLLNLVFNIYKKFPKIFTTRARVNNIRETESFTL